MAQDQRHLLTTVRTAMKLTKTRKKSFNKDENNASKKITSMQRHAPTSRAFCNDDLNILHYFVLRDFQWSVQVINIDNYMHFGFGLVFTTV